MMEFKIEMKMKVKDEITGFTGITIARCEYFTGCIHWQIQAICIENKPGKSQWIDESRLIPIGRKAVKKKAKPWDGRRSGDPDDPPGMDKPPGVRP
jgi:hypothetical protein